MASGETGSLHGAPPETGDAAARLEAALLRIARLARAQAAQLAQAEARARAAEQQPAPSIAAAEPSTEAPPADPASAELARRLDLLIANLRDALAPSAP